MVFQKYFLKSEANLIRDEAYVFGLSDQFLIDSEKYYNISRFFNHRCYMFNMRTIECSGYYENAFCTRIYFVATKDIKPGDELTFNYYPGFDKKKIYPFYCNCGSARCQLK